jgi:sec-independent protein translocase protein TatC
MPLPTTRANDEAANTRMSFGDHLEELRRRLIYSIAGLVVATIICFNFGDRIIEILTTPYCVAMERLGFDPRMVQLNPIESFMEYFKISLKFGLVMAAPWVLYQLWKFVAVGLYPSERRVVRYFAPASIVLFVVGASFMVFIVLAGVLQFLIGISTWFPLPSHENIIYRLYGPRETIETTSQPGSAPLDVPVLSADPRSPEEGQIWFNAHSQRLSIRHGNETYYYRMQKTSDRQFVQPFFSVSEYLGFVVNLALAFGCGFQIPIVVVFLIAVGIVRAAAFSQARKYIILAVAVLSAVLTPTPDVGTMLLLMVPMILLFEIGLLIGRMVERGRQAA